MKPARPVMRGMILDVTEIGKGQEEYETLPCVYLGHGVYCSRWEFEPGEAESFAATHRIFLRVLGGGFRAHSLSPHAPRLDRQPEPAFTAGYEGEAAGDFRFARFEFDEAAARDALWTGSVYLLQWTEGELYQPVALLVGATS